MSNTSTKIAKIFGLNATNIDDYPPTTPDSTGYSAESGYPANYGTTDFPTLQQFNRLFFELFSVGYAHYQNKIYRYDSAYATALGGYKIDATVMGDDGETIYLSTANNNMTNPNSGGAGWKVLASSSNAKKWDSFPVGTCQPFVPSVMGSDIATWLAAHPNWDKLDNAIIADIEGRAMAVASGTYVDGTQAGNDNAIIPYHTHTATQSSHTHTATQAPHAHTYIDTQQTDDTSGSLTMQVQAGTANQYQIGTSSTTATAQPTIGISNEQPAISINYEGVSTVNQNIQRTQYLSWIIKVA